MKFISSPKIDYNLVYKAISYYTNKGYTYLEVPWVVSKYAINATCPVSGDTATEDQAVASGEQSFIQLILEGTMDVGNYVCATPCLRPWDEGKSYVHFRQFFKVELMKFRRDCLHMEDLFIEYESVKQDAFNFMNEYVKDIKIIEVKDDPRVECRTIINHDIVTKDGLELGSYGIRGHVQVGTWIYGTGLALPRFTSIWGNK